MTEDMIERMVERKIDALDHKFMNSPMTQEEYDSEINAINEWAKDKLDPTHYFNRVW